MAGACPETLAEELHKLPPHTRLSHCIMCVLYFLLVWDNNIHHVGFMFSEHFTASIRQRDPSCDGCCIGSPLQVEMRLCPRPDGLGLFSESSRTQFRQRRRG